MDLVQFSALSAVPMSAVAASTSTVVQRRKVAAEEANSKVGVALLQITVVVTRTVVSCGSVCAQGGDN
jgi:hypothetical protein